MADLADRSPEERARIQRALEKAEASGALTENGRRNLDALRALEAGGANANTFSGNVEAMGRGALQGATLGTSDELYAAGSSLMGGDYGEAAEGVRAANRESREAFPTAYRGGQMAGGAAASLVPLGGTMTAMRGASTGARALGAGLTNAATVGFERAMETDPAPGSDMPDALAQRAAGAYDPVGLGIGFGAGVAAPLAARGIGGMVGAARGTTAATQGAGISGRAARRLRRSVGDDAAFVDDVQGYLRGMGDESMIADLGRNTRNQAAAVASIPGPGAQRLVRAVDERGATAADRVARDLDQVAGPAQNQTAARAVRAADRAETASPLYRAALEYDQPLDTGAVAARLDRLIDAKRPGRARFAALRSEMVDADGSPIPLTAEQMHNLRSDLSDDLIELRRTGRPKQISATQDALAALDEQLDTVPGYSDARATWADAMALEEAAELGANAFKTSRRADEIEAVLESMSEPERQAFRSAAREAIQFDMDRVTNPDLKGSKFFRSPEASRKAELIFGEGAAEALERRTGAEREFIETRGRVAGGSDTAARQRAQMEVAPLAPPDVGSQESVLSRAYGAANVPFNTAIDSMMAGPRALSEMGEALASQGARRDELVRALMQDVVNTRGGEMSPVARAMLERLIQAGGGGVAIGGAN